MAAFAGRAAASAQCDGAAARLIRAKFRVGRHASREDAPAADVRRMQAVLGRADDLRALLARELEVLRRSGYTVGQYTHNAAVSCLADVGKYDDALLFCEESSHRLDRATISALLKAVLATPDRGLREKRKEIDFLWETVNVQGIRPTRELFGAYLAALLHAGGTDDFFDKFHSAHAAGLPLGPVQYAMCILACDTLPEAEAVASLMAARGVPATRDHLHALLVQARNAEDPEGAARIFADFARSRGVAPLEKDWCALLSVYKDAGLLAKGRRAYAAMHKALREVKSTLPAVLLMKTIVVVLHRATAAPAGNPGSQDPPHENALSACPQEPSAEQAPFSKPESVCVETLVEEAEALFEASQRKRVSRGHHAWTTLFKVYALAGRRARAEELLARVRRERVPAPFPLKEAISLNGLTHQPRRRDGLHVWHERISHRASTNCHVVPGIVDVRT
ncbi:hypothetical protein DIPPA_26686 [Diplonema papillatum]|nr:hypothetical protein DIPPA_26686 [Diplonema papillatum]